MKRIRLELRNKFGGKYIINAMPKKKIEHIIDNIDWEEIIRISWDKHIDDYGRTEAQLDITTGEIVYRLYSQNSNDYETHFIILYTIPENTLGNAPFHYKGDILNEKEYAEYQKLITSENISSNEAMNKLGINFNERFKEFLIWCWYEGEEEETLESIREQIDNIYKIKG